MNRKDHWMVGVQFHPEFKSRPYKPSSLYFDFIKECIKYKKSR
ncbi:MAG: glutamine amidotransferase-related protein [Candidatus Hodarchaeales archaeon]